MLKLILYTISLFLPFIANADLFKNHDSALPIEVTSDHLTVKEKEELAEFQGNVIAVQGKVEIKSDRMLVYYNKDKQQDTQSISKIEVFGNVKIENHAQTGEVEEAESNYGIYNVSSNLLTLSKNVRIRKGDNLIKGNKFTYDLKTGKSIMSTNEESGKSGRVKGVFVPKNSKADK